MPDLAGEIPVVFISVSATKNSMARSLRYQANEFLIEPISMDEIAKIIDDSIDSRLRNDNNNVLMIGDLVLNK
jgi:DNA-binding NtrC family response regulator